jgi:hypothetical protein
VKPLDPNVGTDLRCQVAQSQAVHRGTQGFDHEFSMSYDTVVAPRPPSIYRHKALP